MLLALPINRFRRAAMSAAAAMCSLAVGIVGGVQAQAQQCINPKYARREKPPDETEVNFSFPVYRAVQG